MKIIIQAVFLLVFCYARTQTISGNVYDEADNQPLIGVSVYLDGTTIASVTDEMGAFTITVPQGMNKSLVFSYLGYEKIILENPLSYKARLKVLMKADAEVLEEVVIQGKTIFTRKQMLRAFRELFLGNSRNGSSCSIENEEDIQLYYDSSTATLHAEARKPIRIKNKRLEYNVSFDLVAFEVAYFNVSLDVQDIKSTFYAGTTFFKDLSKKGSADKKRRQAYEGSTTHLMRTIYNNDWQKQGFDLYVDRLPIHPDSCFAITDSLKYKKITLKEIPGQPVPNVNGMKMDRNTKRDFTKTKYVVLYKKKDQSTLLFNEREFYIDENGLFFPITAVVFTGYMGNLKAGDLLPDDYKYTESD